MPFRVSGKNLDLGDALRDRINDRIAETVGKYFDGGYSGHVTLAKDGYRIPHRMRDPSRFEGHAARRREARPMPMPAPIRRRTRIEKQLRRYHRRLKDHRVERGDGTSIDAASYIIAAPEEGNEVDIDAFTPVVIAEIDHDIETALGQRCGDGTRHDRSAGACLSTCRAWRNQHRVSPRRRAFRLDRSAAAGGCRCPLTRLRGLPMFRRL